jgi:hypothetical protein
MKKLLVLICLLMVSELYSQKEDYIWIYGNDPYDMIDSTRAADTTRGSSNIDFNYDPVKLYYVPGRFVDMEGANTSICDENGQLITYTDGMRIYDKYDQSIVDTINYDYGINFWCREWEQNNIGNHQMAVPIGLAGIQRAIILPMDDKLHYFYNTYNFCKDSLYRVLVTTLRKYGINDNDLLIDTKDSILIRDRLAFNIQAVRHGNGRDWWLLQFKVNMSSYFLYLISPKGIDYYGEVDFLESDFIEYVGSIAFSNSGNFLSLIFSNIFTASKAEFFISEFDRCSGIVTNSFNKDIPNGIVECTAFSHDDQYLYFAISNQIYQCDMGMKSLEEIMESCELIAERDDFVFQHFNSNIPVNFGQTKLGPDGRLYITPITGINKYLSVIEYPYEKGMASDVRQHIIEVPTIIAPTIPNLPHYRLGPLDGSPCDTLGLDNHPVAKFRYAADTIDVQRIRFTDLSYYRPEEWYWDFGDGRSSTERYPWHRYDQGGVYEVCLTVSNENSSNTTCRTLVIGTSSTEDAPQPDITLYPNPVQDQLLVILGDYIPVRGNMYLYDSQGRLVRTERIYYGWNSIDVSQLHSGIYFYRMMDGGMEIGSGKIIKL